MAEQRRVWMKLGSDEREVVVGALTVDCPFCGGPMGSVAGEVFDRGTRCACGAVVVREQPGGVWESSPGVMGEAFRVLRQRIQRSIIGHDFAVQQLALLGARHLHRGGRQRALVIGPSGTGKTTLANALAHALGCPMAVWDVSVSAEVGWSGVDAGQVFAELYRSYDESVLRLSRSVLVLDEVDKLAVREAKGTSRDHRLGQQKSLLGILGGGVAVRFPADGDKGRVVSVYTDNMLILGLGTFEGLGEDPGPNELVKYGYRPEFASRFPLVMSLDELGLDGLVEVLVRETRPCLLAARDFGFEVTLSEAAVRYAASAVRRGGSDTTPRAGAGWLQAAVDRSVLRLLDLEARPGTSYEVQPDDVRIPKQLERDSSR